MSAPDANLHQQVVDRTNRLSESTVRLLLFVAVVGHLVFFAAFGWWLWIHLGPGATFMLGIVVTASWIVWLRQIEFNRAFPRDEDDWPPVRFRRPDVGPRRD